MASLMSRSRFNGTPEELAAAWQAVSKRDGKSFCKYPCESEKVAEAKTCPESIVKHKDLILVSKAL